MSKGRPLPEYFRRPDQLIEELGIESPEEIDVNAIAAFCKATIVYEPLDGCDARILGCGSEAIITVNSATTNESRRRFSAAHELGHWMYDRGQVAFGCTDESFRKGWKDKGPEYRANQYAANILMPAKMFKSYAQNLRITISTSKELAAKFRTSLTATMIRLVELGSFPCALVCVEDGARSWFKTSPHLPSALRILERPGKKIVANAVTAAPPGSESTGDLQADVWIDHPEAYRYWIHEEAINIGYGQALSLLSWKSEAQILAAMREEER